jgi:hypothetical protein
LTVHRNNGAIYTFGGLSMVAACPIISISITSTPHFLYGIDPNRSLREIGTATMNGCRWLCPRASSPASRRGASTSSQPPATALPNVSRLPEIATLSDACCRSFLLLRAAA